MSNSEFLNILISFILSSLPEDPALSAGVGQFSIDNHYKTEYNEEIDEDLKSVLVSTKSLFNTN
jgi:hypothetical protein